MGKKSGKIVATVVTLTLLLNAGLVHASDSQAGTEQEVIVVYKNEKGKEKVFDNSVEVSHEFDTVPAVAATVTNSDLYQLVKDPNIASIERNISFRITGGDFKVTAVPAEQSQWNFQAVQPTKMWNEGVTGAGVKVAVIDSGIFAHSELTIAGGISTVDYTTNYSDDNGHGTHVAGIIAAKNNGTGLVGVAPDVQLYAVKSMDQNGDGNLQDVLEGLEWSIENGMDIINISLGTDTESPLLHEMVDRAYAAGIVVVGSAGNSQEGIPTTTYTVNYPAKYDSVIAVAAVNNLNERGVFSSVGPEVEIAAPGVDVISTYRKSDGTGGFAKASGTSQAAPHVAGMIALLMQKNPSMTNVQLREEVKKYAVDIGAPGRDTEFGVGSVTFNKDVTAPANVTNVQVTGKTENSISLAWVNPADSDFALNNIYANNVKVGNTANETFTLNALQPNTPYTIAVKSVDQNGNESVGETVVETTNADATAPAEVSNLTVVNKTATTAKISWTNPTDSDFKRANLFANGTPVGNVTGTEYEFTALTPNTDYVLEVKTEDMLGNVSVGQSVTVKTDDVPVVDTTAPAEVAGLASGDVTTTSAEITWTNPSDPDFSKVNLYKDNSFVGDVSGTRYVFSGLTPNTTYVFTAKTVDATGNESQGQTVTVKTNEEAPVVDTVAPADVTGLTVGNVTKTTAEVSWTNPSDPDFAKAYLYLNGSKVDETSGTSYVFTGLTPNTDYVLQVKTVDTTGNISTGKYVMAKTQAEPVVDTTPPSEVGNLIVSNATEDSLEFSWNNPSDADFDHVVAYFEGQPVDVAGNVYRATGLAPNTTYTFLIKTVDQANNESVGRTIPATTSAVVQPPVDNTAPAEVSNFEVVGKTTTSINVSWTNPSDPDFAKAYLYLNGNKVNETAGTSFTYAGLTPNTSYVLEVKTVDNNGNVSQGRSIQVQTEQEVEVTPPTDPVDPTVPTQPPVDVTAPAEVTSLEVASVTESTVRVRWVNPVDADYAKANVYLNGNLVADTTNSYYEFTGLTADTAYTIAIKTIDTSGNVSTGKTIVGRTQASAVVNPPTEPTNPTDPQPPVVDTTAPAEVTELVAEATTATSITARWNNPADSDFAKVKLFINGNYVAEATGSSYEFTGLVADTAYTIIVKTVDASGNISTGKTLDVRTQAAPVVVTPPTTPTTPTEPSVPGDVVTLPTNPTPAPGGNSGGGGFGGGGGGGSAVITLPSTTQEVPAVKDATAALEKAKDSLTIVDFVGAKSAIQALTDEQKRAEFQKELETLKQELKIADLPTKNEVRTSVPVGISLQVAMKSANYKYIDESSIKPGKNVFVLNSKGELVNDVVIHVVFNRIFVTPKDGQFDSKETFTIILDTTVKGKAVKDSTESFELKTPLIMEFTTR